MLQEITLKNFKIFEEVTISSGLITVLIGPNGSGKSSIFQALGLMKQSVGRDHLRFDGPIVQGDLADFVHIAELKDEAKIGFKIASDAGPIEFFFPLALERKRRLDVEDLARLSTTIVQNTLETVYIIPALRGFERLKYQQLPEPVQEETDLMVAARSFEERAQTLATILLHDSDKERKVSEWLAQVIQHNSGHRLIPDYHIALKTSDGEAKFNIAHEDLGASQLIYLFTQIALAPNKSTICIDEPEIHLHPKAQAALSKVLVDIALNEGKQLMLSTNSEHILMTLLTLVAEDRLKPDDLAVYYFQRTEDGDSTTAERIEVNDKGQIRGGLRGFFEADLDETDRYVKALFKKAKA